MMRTPYPITAHSAACGLGRSTQEVFDHLRAGQRGLTPCPLDIPFSAMTGSVPGDLARVPDAWSAYDARVTRLAHLVHEEIKEAVQAACDRWGSSRVGVALGTSTGGIGETEQAYARWKTQDTKPPAHQTVYRYETQHTFHSLADFVAGVSGIDGPRCVVSTACSSSAKVFAVARRWMDAEVADAVLVGGVDALCHTTVRGFKTLGVMADRYSRPFGEDRPGMNVGEGAALVLLERLPATDGDTLAWLLGVGETSDAYRMSSPEPSGRGAAAAMRAALDDAGLSAPQVDCVQAHGTGTRHNDSAESMAIEHVFGTDTPVVSTKSYTAHTLGACGALEAVLSIHSLREGWIPPNLGLPPVDPEIHLALPTQPLRQRCRYVMSNAFAFGGNNCCLLLGADS